MGLCLKTFYCKKSKVVTLGKNIQISTLILRRVVLVANIKPSIILGYMSKAKIITTVDVAEVTPIYPPEGSEPGDVVIARGFPREPLPVLEPKARIYQTVSGLFKTNNESIVCYQRIPWEVEGKGFVNIYHFPNVLVR
ncbi:aminoacyl tRNA synthase complex-interacting multifunctional protein 1-like [Lycorma delicatula]|uniref:aminoacyl tRNA synthase complex-interacting multifunctional protein 1-like n=1 Tax=Lycorma delicatula TaxID=130591 RepID=UPI003F5140B1